MLTVIMLVAVISLLAYIIYLITTDPAAENTEELPEEFPAEQIIKDIEQDFDQLINKMNGIQADKNTTKTQDK